MRRRYAHLSALTLLLGTVAALPAFAQTPLNDTGVVTCYNDTASTGGTEPGTHPRQDCRLGRDAANAVGVLYKFGAGTKGFDFTKVANNGGALPAVAALGSNPGDWACTFDDVTGLMWEVKTAAGLRSTGNTYTWYSTDPAANGGLPGTQNGGACTGGINCDTQSFVAAVNSGAGLCGRNDWRMPTTQELKTLVDFSQSGLGITVDVTYFPNTQPHEYWTIDGNSLAAVGPQAFYAGFVLFGGPSGGESEFDFKSKTFPVRLVRSGP